jgi:hypothetical protein
MTDHDLMMQAVGEVMGDVKRDLMALVEELKQELERLRRPKQIVFDHNPDGTLRGARLIHDSKDVSVSNEDGPRESTLFGNR